MRKLYLSIIFFSFVGFACTKSGTGKITRSAENEPPVIKILTPTDKQILKPYDQLKVKAVITDIDLVAIASWEAINAEAYCGANPYRGSFSPMVYDYELSFSFTIPPAFPGDHIIRLYGIDASGNIATADIPYKSTN